MSNDHGYCMVSTAPVRSDNKDQSEIVTQLLFGELISINEIKFPWARISTLADGYNGWVDFKHLKILSQKEMKRWINGLSYSKDRERLLKTPWGNQYICRGSFVPEIGNYFSIGKDEFEWLEDTNNKNNSILDFAKEYLNTPYLWGGKTPFGIDCSGLTQIIYRLVGFYLPRDTYDQVKMGATIDFEEIEAGDLAFFENSKCKIIHVGICDGKGQIIHASGHVRIDKLTKRGIINKESKYLTHTLSIIKRL